MTIKDVAKMAGVSPTTVSRVLNRRGPLSKKTIHKVESAIEALGYYPNESARMLSGKKSRVLGVILSSFHSPFHAELLQHIYQASLEAGYNILIAPSERDNLHQILQAVDFLLRHQVAGIIFALDATNETLSEARGKCGSTPLVTLLHQIDPQVPAVISDDRQGGILAARHLIAKGCTKIVHISGALLKYRSADERSYAFMEECAKHGIAYKNYAYSGESMRLGDMQETIRRVFSDNPDMNGLFLSNDIFAAQAISTALSMAYRIPDDIRIIGYDDIMISSLTYPQITTIRQNFEGLAQAAVRSVIDLISGLDIPLLETIPVSLIERKTT